METPSGVFRQPDAGELPARRRREEIAIARTHMAGWRDAGTAAQHHLIDHELAVVFGDRAGGRSETRIGLVGRARPFPDVAEHLQYACRRVAAARMRQRAVEEMAMG